MNQFISNFSQFISHHWQLWLILAVLLILIFVNEMLSQRQRAKELSTAAAVEMINHHNAIVFDLRPIDAFQAGHIIDAKRVTEEDFQQPRMEQYKNQPIILVCPKGLQSATIAKKLRTQGFTQPMVLSGGMSAWQSAQLPLIKGKS